MIGYKGNVKRAHLQALNATQYIEMNDFLNSLSVREFKWDITVACNTIL